MRIRFPVKLRYCTDNAAMIGAAAFFLVQEQGEEAFASFETQASLPLGCALQQ
jgi:tRNA A37 threonylcarbamoyltransferase TsaD